MKNSISDPQWCIDNDWQVYIVPFELKKAKIAIRKGGITSHGKDHYFDKINEVSRYSNQIIGKIVYKNQTDASNNILTIMNKLRKRYEI